MDRIDIFAIIEKYNLAVRRIPDEVKMIRKVGGFGKEGTTQIIGGRECDVKMRVPKHAGYYMVQSINNTDSMVRWDLKRNHAAPTLIESIELYLTSENKPEARKKDS